MSQRAVFISHAVADKELVNFFSDTLLTSGIGIGHQHIFNVSAHTSPLQAGENFTPAIREALVSTKVIFAIITPTYLQRPFAMAELGAAWALKKLTPILVPPTDFSNLEGILVGTQCLRIDSEAKLGEIYDRFDLSDINSERWFTRAGFSTFSVALKKFTEGLPNFLPKHEKSTTPLASPVRVTEPRAPPPPPPAPTLEEELSLFSERLQHLRETLNTLPPEVAAAYFAHADGQLAVVVDTSIEASVLAAERRGLVETERDETDRALVYEPSSNSQRTRDATDAMRSLESLLRNASPAFLRQYESKHDHAASLEAFAFWEFNKLLPDAALALLSNGQIA